MLKTKMADGRCLDMSAADILKAPQRGTEPVRCRCWRGCILAPPGEYDWTIHMLRRCSFLSNYFDHYKST